MELLLKLVVTFRLKEVKGAESSKSSLNIVEIWNVSNYRLVLFEILQTNIKIQVKSGVAGAL